MRGENLFLEGLTKQAIRSKIIFRLKTQKEEDRDRKSRLIRQKLFRTLRFKKAKVVMFFISFGGEVNTREMIKKAMASGKIVAVPVCKRGGVMRPSMLTEKTKLVRGLYEIYEPAIKKFVKLADLDLVIVPGIAFDRKGNRLGRGKGYYDTFLHKLKPHNTASIGLAFDFQILPSLPATTQDVSVTKIIYA